MVKWVFPFFSSLEGRFYAIYASSLEGRWEGRDENIRERVSNGIIFESFVII